MPPSQPQPCPRCRSILVKRFLYGIRPDPESEQFRFRSDESDSGPPEWYCTTCGFEWREDGLSLAEPKASG